MAYQVHRRDLARMPVDLDREIGRPQPFGDLATAIVDGRLDDHDVDAGPELRRGRRRLPDRRGGTGERDEGEGGEAAGGQPPAPGA